MSEGTYRDRHGDVVTVTRTEKGWLLRYADGRIVTVSR